MIWLVPLILLAVPVIGLIVWLWKLASEDRRARRLS